MHKTNAWVIRAGEKGAGHDLFLDESLVALQDQSMGDLRRISPCREAFYKRFQKHHSDASRIAVSGIAGKFYRFFCEADINDIIIYPCIKDGYFYCGRLTGPYFYVNNCRSFPHRRNVRWTHKLNKSELPVEARRELGAARTFFVCDTHLPEVMRLFRSKGKQLSKSR